MNAQLVPTQMSVAERDAQALNKEETETEIKALVERSKPIVSVSDAETRGECHRSLMTLVNLRVAIQKRAKEGRDEAVQYSKAVIGIEKGLVALISPEEERLAGIRDEWDSAKEREREAKVLAEQRRVEVIQAKVEEIRATAVHATTLDSLMLGQLCLKADHMVIDPAVFEEFTPKAQEALTVTRAALAGLLAKRKEHEAEQERVKAERAELAKLRAEAAERDRLAAEAQARADAEAKAERERLEEIARQERLAEARAHAQKIAEDRQRLADEEAAAKAQRDAEAKRHAEANRLEREESQRQAAARQAELDRQKEENDARAEEQRQAQALEAGRLTAEREKLAKEQAALAESQKQKQSKSEQKRLAAMKGYPTRAELLDGVAAYFKTDADTARGWLSFYDWKVDERKSA